MFKAHIAATMLDEETAEWLSTDEGWLQAQWPECVNLAEGAEQVVTGDPVLARYTLIDYDPDQGYLYDFEFDVPVE